MYKQQALASRQTQQSSGLKSNPRSFMAPAADENWFSGTQRTEPILDYFKYVVCNDLCGQVISNRDRMIDDV